MRWQSLFRCPPPPGLHTPTEYPDDMDKPNSGRNPNLPPNHPINALSPRRKLASLLVLSYVGFLPNFAIAIVLCAFEPMAERFSVSPLAIAQTIGYGLLGTSIGPLFWNPLTKTVGRRPVYLIGSFLFLPFCVWQAQSYTYGSFVAARFLTSFMVAWSQTVPPSSVSDMFIPQVRGEMMSMYGVGVVFAPPLAPLFCAAIVNASNWRNLFWFIFSLAGLQLILVYITVPETLWVEDEPQGEKERAALEAEKAAQPRDIKQQPNDIEAGGAVQQVEVARPPPPPTPKSGHVGVAWYPWQNWREYGKISLSPILLNRYLCILIPSFYYGSVFAWSVGLTVVTPVLLQNEPYHFKLVPTGCAFLAYAIGSILGKWSGGLVADKVMAYVERRNGTREPEDRLWALIPILPLMFIGMTIYGAVLQYKKHWIGVLIGGAVYFFALCAATGIIQTYVLETYLEKSMDTQAVFTFWKMMWGFTVAFYAMKWAEEGFLWAYIVQGCLSGWVGAIMVAGLLWKGKAIRMWQGMPEFRH